MAQVASDSTKGLPREDAPATEERSFVDEKGETIEYEPLAGTREAKERYGAELKRFGMEHGDERLEVVSPYQPAGDQPKAIASLAKGVEDGLRYQTLLGVTGSGKTFSMAKTIEAVQKPTLIMEPNKTLAAQVASEMRELFPNNAVVYFVSYYDYYQPEAYVPQTDTYIEKDASINEEVEKLRHQATSSLLSRRDVIVVASVSCIYGIGSPQDYAGLAPNVDKSVPLERDDLVHELIDIQYDRNDYDLQRGMFRVRGDTVDVFPPYAENPLRISFFGDEVELIAEIDGVTGEIVREYDAIPIWPASHYVTARPKINHAIKTIEEELEHRVKELKDNDMILEAQRLSQRTGYDIEMLETMGYCSGIENYSRHMDGRRPGEPPYTLIDYFPSDMLCIIDESHVTVPQIRGMYEGDRSRKVTLVDHGFRLPSALDNRPLRFDEFEQRIPQFIYVSATPGDYEEQAGTRPDRRPSGRDKGPRRPQGARARDHAHEAHGGGPDGPPPRRGHPRQLHALRHGDPRPHRHHPRPEAWQDRRARGHQPAARGPGHPRGLARRDPRRGQGGLPPQPPLAHPDHGPRGA